MEWKNFMAFPARGFLSEVSVKVFLECILLRTTVNVLPMSLNYWFMRAYHLKIEPAQVKGHLFKIALNKQNKSQTVYIIFP